MARPTTYASGRMPSSTFQPKRVSLLSRRRCRFICCRRKPVEYKSQPFINASQRYCDVIFVLKVLNLCPSRGAYAERSNVPSACPRRSVFFGASAPMSRG
jgi:hypothetical protein